MTIASLLTYLDNAMNFSLLLEQVRKQTPPVPFVGAGLSIPCGLKGWTQFLLDGGAGLLSGQRAALDGHVRGGKFEEAAELLRVRKSALWLSTTIQAQYGQDRYVRSDIRGAVKRLPALTSGLVITTNFDRILESTFSQARKPFTTKVWGARAGLIGQGVANDAHYLLKLHGDALDATDRVLTQSEYERHYAEPLQDGQTSLSSVLKQIARSRTLLFLGCSLGRDRTMEVLAEVAKEWPHEPHHFAIVEAPSTPQEQEDRSRFLYERKIRPVCFQRINMRLSKCCLMP